MSTLPGLFKGENHFLTVGVGVPVYKVTPGYLHYSAQALFLERWRQDSHGGGGTHPPWGWSVRWLRVQKNTGQIKSIIKYLPNNFIMTYNIGHKRYEPRFHVFLMEIGAMTFVTHFTVLKCSKTYPQTLS